MKTILTINPKLTPEQIDTLVAVKKWMNRIVDRAPELPASFMDNTDPTPLAKKFAKMVNGFRLANEPERECCPKCSRGAWKTTKDGKLCLLCGHEWEAPAKCQDCGDTGLADTGGVHPSGEGINIPCPECSKL